MKLARRMLAAGLMGRVQGAESYPSVTAAYVSPGGAGDYADFNTNVAARAVFAGTGAPVFTIACWAQVNVAGGATDLYTVSDDGAPRLTLNAADDPILYAIVGNAAGTLAGTEDGATFSGAWEPLVVVCDGTNVTAYQGGVAGTPVALPAVNYATVDAFRLFEDAIGKTEKLANFAIFTRALSGAEIAAIHAAGVSTDIRTIVGNDPTLAVYIRDADTAGSVANAGNGGACALTFHGNVISVGIAYPDITAAYSSPGGAGDITTSTPVAALLLMPASAGTLKNTSWTVRVWAQRDDDTGFGQSVWLGTPNQANLKFFGEDDDARLGAYASDGAHGTVSAEQDLPIFTGAFRQLTVVNDAAADTLLLYLDDTLADSGSTAAQTTALTPGTALVFLSEFAGKLANIAVDSRAWSAAEVAALATAGPAHNIRNQAGAWAGGAGVVSWDTADVAGSVANTGTGGVCAGTFNGDVETVAL